MRICKCGKKLIEDLEPIEKVVKNPVQTFYLHGSSREVHRYYLKSEADKAIADLEESNKKEVGQLLIEIAELKAQKAQAEDDCAYWKTKSRKCADDNEVMAKQRAEAFRRESPQKYKRCLDNVWWCKKLSHVYALSAYTHRGWKIAVYYDEKAELYRKWCARWLKIAEQFKDKEA